MRFISWVKWKFGRKLNESNLVMWQPEMSHPKVIYDSHFLIVAKIIRFVLLVFSSEDIYIRRFNRT